MESSIPIAKPKPPVIAPKSASNTPSSDLSDHTTFAAIACRSCSTRKIRCSKHVPRCVACVRLGSGPCEYPPPQPRQRKRKLEEPGESPSGAEHRSHGAHQTAIPYPRLEQSTTVQIPSTGRLIAETGRSRYVDSFLFRRYGDNLANELEEADQVIETLAENQTQQETSTQNVTQFTTPAANLDPVTACLLGGRQSLKSSYPAAQQAIRLWEIFEANVLPICRILHAPTMRTLHMSWTKQPEIVSPGQECLLFAIYHFAIYASSGEECDAIFGLPTAPVLASYRAAFLQALVNVNWLATTEMVVLQAVVLYLMTVRYTSDPNSHWIMTGIAMRIAQRMGLHRDGAALGLSPFDTEMRRRLFWQLLPLDGYAAQASGTGIGPTPGSWDTKLPLNVNDSQLSPDDHRQVMEQKGATDMIYVLMKGQVSDLFNRTAIRQSTGEASIRLRDQAELDAIVDEVESRIEERFLRYCDVIEPLHMYTLSSARGAINFVRLHSRMPEVVQEKASDDTRRHLCALSSKLLDSSDMVFVRPELARFRWQARGFFVWDALLCILSSINKVGFFTAKQVNEMWTKVENIYTYRPDLLHANGPLRSIIGRMTLQAWNSNPPSDSVLRQPDFISTLYLSRSRRAATRVIDGHDSINAQLPSPQSLGVADTPNTDVCQDNVALQQLIDADLQLALDFDFGNADWDLWNALVKNDQIYPSS